MAYLCRMFCRDKKMGKFGPKQNVQHVLTPVNTRGRYLAMLKRANKCTRATLACKNGTWTLVGGD